MVCWFLILCSVRRNDIAGAMRRIFTPFTDLTDSIDQILKFAVGSGNFNPIWKTTTDRINMIKYNTNIRCAKEYIRANLYLVELKGCILQ